MIQIDIEMPKTCGQCFCAMEDYDYNTVRCRFKYDLCFDANSRDYLNRRLDGCPLHEVTDTDTISRQKVISTINVLRTRCDTDDIDDYHDLLVEAMEVLPSSPSRPQWIPVTERLPEVAVLCCDTRGEMIIGYPYQDEESNTGYGAVLDDVVMIDCTAWMPLPESYHRP